MKKSALLGIAALAASLTASPLATAADYWNWGGYHYATDWTAYPWWDSADSNDDDSSSFGEDIPAAGSHPTANQQHYWQSRGNINGNACGDEVGTDACDAHKRAVAYARNWSRLIRPGCTKLPSGVRRKSESGQERYIMLKMYVALSKEVWTGTDESAAAIWKDDRGLNRWCPGLRDANTDDVTFP